MPSPSAEALTVSLPPSALMVSRSSVASGAMSFTTAESPPIFTPPDTELATTMLSLPLVPLMITLLAWPSPPPTDAARLRLIVPRPVPVRSLTVMVSAPPRAFRLICSSPLRSMVISATSRVSRTRLPLGKVEILVDVGTVE